MTTKTTSQTNKKESVRINIDGILEQYVLQIKEENPLATTAEAVKYLIGQSIASMEKEKKRKAQAAQEINRIIEGFEIDNRVKKLSDEELENFIEKEF